MKALELRTEDMRSVGSLLNEFEELREASISVSREGKYIKALISLPEFEGFCEVYFGVTGDSALCSICGVHHYFFLSMEAREKLRLEQIVDVDSFVVEAFYRGIRLAHPSTSGWKPRNRSIDTSFLYLFKSKKFGGWLETRKRVFPPTMAYSLSSIFNLGYLVDTYMKPEVKLDNGNIVIVPTEQFLRNIVFAHVFLLPEALKLLEKEEKDWRIAQVAPAYPSIFLQTNKWYVDIIDMPVGGLVAPLPAPLIDEAVARMKMLEEKLRESEEFREVADEYKRYVDILKEKRDTLDSLFKREYYRVLAGRGDIGAYMVASLLTGRKKQANAVWLLIKKAKEVLPEFPPKIDRERLVALTRV